MWGPRNPEMAPGRCPVRMTSKLRKDGLRQLRSASKGKIAGTFDAIRIENIRPSDYDEMLSLWERAGLPFKPTGRDSRKDMLRQMRLPTALYLKATDYRTAEKNRGASGEKKMVAKGRGVMVAVVLGTQDGRKGWVNRLAVLPGYRKKGLGKRLVRELERRFAKMGLGIFTCQIEDWNTVSLKVFKRLGYQLHKDISYLTKRRVKGI